MSPPDRTVATMTGAGAATPAKELVSVADTTFSTGLVERSAAASASGMPEGAGDDGFFGPASVTWRMSADLASPVAVLRSLLMQALHPLALHPPAMAGVAPSSYDGDSPGEVRRFARERSRWIFSNPDMIHLSLLRNHARWAVFLRNLQFIVVDECHYYRGIFGSNVAMVLRRLLRLCTRYSSAPTVIFASATTAQPAPKKKK